MGVWSSGDSYLTEEQVTGSADFVQSSCRYERLEDLTHWFPAEAPEQLAPLLLDHWRQR